MTCSTKKAVYSSEQNCEPNGQVYPAKSSHMLNRGHFQYHFGFCWCHPGSMKGQRPKLCVFLSVSRKYLILHMNKSILQDDNHMKETSRLVVSARVLAFSRQRTKFCMITMFLHPTHGGLCTGTPLIIECYCCCCASS